MRSTLSRLAPLVLLVAVGAGGVELLRSFGSERIGRELAARAQAGDIVMLSSLECSACREAHEWLRTHHVTFDECFIERDARCAAAYQALLSPGTPTLLVRGQAQVGFSAERVAQALRRG